MKTTKLIATGLLALAISASIKAADLCVTENGGGGCYSTITAAINAAASGDRIIITPKAGGSPYAENLTIAKSLQFLCNTEGGQWVLSGNITITPAVGRVITFIGMKNLSGTIAPTGASPAGARCKINILSCELVSGSITFDYDNFDMNISSNIMSNGNIQVRYGKIIGNDISTPSNYVSSYSSIYITSDATATNDTLLLIGNKVSGYNFWGASPIYSSTSSQFMYIANNFITANGGSYGILIYYFKNSAVGRNSIYNNTISSASSVVGGIYLTGINLNAYTDIYNNLILGTSGTGISYSGSGPVAASYNFMPNPLTLSGITNDGTNNLTSNTTLDVNGNLNAGSDAINGGSPDEAYYDINLTRSDAGAYGGSFTLSNFYPVTGAARVYFVKAPRKVVLGGTLDVKAESFDR